MKLFLQILLTLGCLALAVGMVQEALQLTLLAPPEGWWRGAMAFWMLIVAVRMVYPEKAK